MSERISDMLQYETYIGYMVHGRSVKVSYKSKKTVHQPRESWVVVKNTHEPIIDRETFRKGRTYDFLLKGIIFCHECGYPLAVLNRRNAKGEDVMFFRVPHLSAF